MTSATRGSLPHGLRVFQLTRISDDRGSLTELFRPHWSAYELPRQWNVVTSRPGVLRGIHVHTRGAEYYALLSGRAVVGYQDLRAGSPTFGASCVIEIGGDGPAALVAPPGLAHGVYAAEAFSLLVGTTGEWDPASELGCHWRDPGLGIRWPFESAVVSGRDDSLGRLQDVAALVPGFDGSGERPA